MSYNLVSADHGDFNLWDIITGVALEPPKTAGDWSIREIQEMELTRMRDGYDYIRPTISVFGQDQRQRYMLLLASGAHGKQPALTTWIVWM